MSHRNPRGSGRRASRHVVLVAALAVAAGACDVKVETAPVAPPTAVETPPVAPPVTPPPAVAAEAAVVAPPVAIVPPAAADMPTKDIGRYFDRFKGVEATAEVDPSKPPEYLRVRTTDGDGKTWTFFLVRYSVRRDDYQVLVRQADGKLEKIDAGPVRTYRGWCEELPDAMVGAVIMPDGGLHLRALRAVQSFGKATTGSGPGPYAGDKVTGRAASSFALAPSSKYEFISGTPKFVIAAPLAGATFIKANPSGDPNFSNCTRVEQSFITWANYYEQRPDEDNPKDYLNTALCFEFSSVIYDLISLRDGLEAFRVSDTMLVRPGPGASRKRARKELIALRRPPSDLVCEVQAGGGGGAGGLGKYNGYSTYVTSMSFTRKTMWHELGHKLNWGGDGIGGNVEGGLLGGSGSCRYGMPAVMKRRGSRQKLWGKGKSAAKVDRIPNPAFPLPAYACCDKADVAMNGIVEIDVLANDFDVNGGEIALAGVEAVSAKGGAIEMVPGAGPDGRDVFRYRAGGDFCGEDRFSYSVVDTDGRVAYGNVIVHVSSPRMVAHWRLDEGSDFTTEIKNAVPGRLGARLTAGMRKACRLKPIAGFGGLHWWGNKIMKDGIGYFDQVRALVQYKNIAFNPNGFTSLDLTGTWRIVGSGDFEIAVMAFAQAIHYYDSPLAGRNFDFATITVGGFELEVNGEVVARDETVKTVKNSKVWSSLGRDLENRVTYRFSVPKEIGPKDKVILRMKLSTDSTGKDNPYWGGIFAYPISTELDDVKGRFGDCIRFYNAQRVIGSESISINTKTASIACWAWVKDWVADAASGKRVGYRRTGKLFHGSVSLISYGKGGPKLRFAVNNPRQAYLDVDLPPTEQWIHIAGVADGESLTVYLNGKPVASRKIAHDPIAATGVIIGENLNGAIDDLRIYSKALTEEEIGVIMRGGRADAPAPADGGSGVRSKLLAWAPSSAAVEQLLYISSRESKSEEAKPVPVLKDGTTDSFAFEGMQENTTYFWRVDTRLANGALLAGKAWTFTTGRDLHVGEHPDVTATRKNAETLDARATAAEEDMRALWAREAFRAKRAAEAKKAKAAEEAKKLRSPTP